MRLVVAAIAVVSGACGVVEATPSGFRHDAIVGGTEDDGGYPDVVMLRAVFTNDAGQTQGFACSGTLITPTVVLTAAHCLNERGGPPGYALTAVTFHNLGVAPPTTSPLWVPAASWRRHPSWSSAAPMNNDLGAVQLPAPLPMVRPSPYGRRVLGSADVNRPMEVVGYGMTSMGGTGIGTRRVVSLPLRGLTTQHLQLGNMSTAGICNGDSGGPSFLVDRDGIRRVVGVHSWTQPGGNCMDGLDARVDQFGPFIRQFLMDTGGASCVEDGLCASGCASPDPDCVCQADGTCNGQCPNLLSDPDCSSDCVANGVCATASCPRPDPDCTSELSTCTMDSQCQYRSCVADPQRSQRYCSRPCSATCAAGTTCVGAVCLLPQLPTAGLGQACTIGGTFCTAGTCSGLPGGATTCRVTCTSDANCPTTDECVMGQNAVRICERKPPEAMPGEACLPNVTRCLGGTTCAGLPGGPTTCRTTCTSDAQCAASDECVMGTGSARICVVRAPPVAAGAPCTPGSSRCESGTGCAGPAAGPTTCRVVCSTSTQCPTDRECVDGAAGLRICEPKPPEATEGAPCTIGLTRCLGGTTCTGLPSAPTTCRETCVLDTQCDANDFCARAQNDVSVCTPQPIFVEPIAIAEAPAPKVGCAAAPSGWLALGLLVLLGRRR